MDREYAQPLDVEALARGAHMSAGHLSREFRLAYGESPYGYLMTARFERAMALLRRGDLGVTEVCFAVGCSSLVRSVPRFTELVGVPPSTYRREALDTARATAGIPSCVVKQVTRPVRIEKQLPRSRTYRDHDSGTRQTLTTDVGEIMTSTEGIKTVLHPVTDLAASKAVYTALLGVEPSKRCALLRRLRGRRAADRAGAERLIAGHDIADRLLARRGYRGEAGRSDGRRREGEGRPSRRGQRPPGRHVH